MSDQRSRGAGAARGRRPVLVVTNHAPPSRLAPFALLREREDADFALFGGRSTHAVAEPERLPFEVLRPSQREVFALAASGRHRAVICGTNGRLALPAGYFGARRAGIPFVLWATLWAQPRSAAGIAGYPLLRHVYAHADAVATYGPHVSEYVRARGARNVVEAPQSVDNEYWSKPGDPAATGLADSVPRFLFTGRMDRAKGVRVLLDAWLRSGAEASPAVLVLVGRGPERARAAAARATVAVGEQPASQVRNFYAAADVVVVPSIPTRTFREPWGLVVNEAMNQGLPIIATDAVGAAAGGLVRHERNGLVVPAGDPEALSRAIRRLRDDAELRARLGAAARADVAAYTPEAWADGMSRALRLAAPEQED